MSTDPLLTPELRDYLASLPPAEPPAGLAARITAKLAAGRRRRRRHRLAGGLALAASVALAALLVPWTQPGPAAPGDDPRLQAQRLEHRLLSAPEGAGGQRGSEVAVIDRALDAAYRRGAGAQEIEDLWQARVRVLEQALNATPVRPAQI